MDLLVDGGRKYASPVVLHGITCTQSWHVLAINPEVGLQTGTLCP